MADDRAEEDQVADEPQEQWAEDQSLDWSPEQYGPLDPEARGRWALVGEDAVLWTDDADAAGVSWLTDAELGGSLRQHFQLARLGGVTATVAYELALRRAGGRVRVRGSGRLEGAEELRRELMDED